MDLSTQDNLIHMCLYQKGPPCWSTVPCQSKPLPENFPGHVSCVLAPTNFVGWVKSSFLDVSSYSTALFPSLSHRSELLLNSESHSPSLVIIRDSLLWNMPCWKCKWYVVGHQYGIISHYRGKATACYFYLYKPIWTSSAYQIFFLFSDKGSQTLTNSCWLMSSTVMWSILISRGQRKAAAFPCSFHIPMMMSLGWLLHMQKVVESQREFCTWKGFKHEMQQEPAAALNELQSNKRCIAYPMNKWYSICDILWVFWILAGILIVSLFT